MSKCLASPGGSSFIASFLAIILQLTPILAHGLCNVGELREQRIPCIAGWMTFPPRTERCYLPPADGWYLSSLYFEKQVLSGTGGTIVLTPELTINKGQRDGIIRYISSQIDSAKSVNDSRRATELSLLLQSVESGAVPLLGARTASAFVTLKSWALSDPFCLPGMATNNCPHAFVPEISVRLICLPSGNWTTPAPVDISRPHNEALSKASGLTPPR